MVSKSKVAATFKKFLWIRYTIYSKRENGKIIIFLKFVVTVFGVTFKGPGNFEFSHLAKIRTARILRHVKRLIWNV